MDQMTSAEELTAAINIKLGQAQDAKSDVSEQDKFISVSGSLTSFQDKLVCRLPL